MALIWFLMPGHGDAFELETLIDWGGSSRELVRKQHQYWRLVSCMFLHAGSMRLAMNMAALLDIGSLVERRLGVFYSRY